MPCCKTLTHGNGAAGTVGLSAMWGFWELDVVHCILHRYGAYPMSMAWAVAALRSASTWQRKFAAGRLRSKPEGPRPKPKGRGAKGSRLQGLLQLAARSYSWPAGNSTRINYTRCRCLVLIMALLCRKFCAEPAVSNLDDLASLKLCLLAVSWLSQGVVDASHAVCRYQSRVHLLDTMAAQAW